MIGIIGLSFAFRPLNVFEKFDLFAHLWYGFLRNGLSQHNNRTQAKLQRLADELPLDDENRLTFHGEDSDVNFVSDGEPERPSKFTNHIAPEFDGQPSSAVALLNGVPELQAGKDGKHFVLCRCLCAKFDLLECLGNWFLFSSNR